MATVGTGPRCHYYKYRLDCDTGDSCPAWPRPRYNNNNNYMDQDNKTTHNCYTALIWLIAGAQVARQEEHYLYELHGCFVSVASPPASWPRNMILLCPEHCEEESESGDDDQDVVYNRTWRHDKKDATLTLLLSNDQWKAMIFLNDQWDVRMPHQFPRLWCHIL